MSEWRDTSTAPKDGTWVLIDLDDGRCDCVDDGVDCRSVHLARWNPQYVADLDATYEWEVLHYGEFNHWCDGRARVWQPLPEPSEAP